MLFRTQSSPDVSLLDFHVRNHFECYQVLKSPRNTEIVPDHRPRLAHPSISTSIFNQLARLSSGGFSYLGADSLAALKNKPKWFIRQVFRSKYFWGPSRSAFVNTTKAGPKGIRKLASPCCEFNPHPRTKFVGGIAPQGRGKTPSRWKSSAIFLQVFSLLVGYWTHAPQPR